MFKASICSTCPPLLLSSSLLLCLNSAHLALPVHALSHLLLLLLEFSTPLLWRFVSPQRQSRALCSSHPFKTDHKNRENPRKQNHAQISYTHTPTKLRMTHVWQRYTQLRTHKRHWRCFHPSWNPSSLSGGLGLSQWIEKNYFSDNSIQQHWPRRELELPAFIPCALYLPLYQRLD